MTCFDSGFSSKDTRNSDNESDDKDNGHDGECKNPLNTKSLGLKLPKSQPSHKECHRESNVVVLEHEQKEQGETKKVPHGYVCEDSTGECLAVNHDGTIPEEGKFDPG